MSGINNTNFGMMTASCDEPECCLMGHCMIHWDEGDNYTGTRPLQRTLTTTETLLQKVPKYTHNKKHEYLSHVCPKGSKHCQHLKMR